MTRPDLLAATRLQLLTRDHDHRLEVELHGDLDLTTAPRLLAALDAGLANPAIQGVAIKADHLRSVDRGGLSMLVDASRRTASSGRSFTVGGPPTCLLLLARRSGIGDLFEPKPSVNAAHEPAALLNPPPPKKSGP